MGLLSVISPAGALPNVISPLASLPELLSPWKKHEKERYEFERTFFMNQLESVKRDWVAGTAKPSYMKLFLEAQEKGGWKDMEGANMVGMMAIAGALTIASPMMSFLLAMVKHNDWLVRLQAEIDEVCGERMPEMGDMERLPLLRAVVKEVVRWRPPVPTGSSSPFPVFRPVTDES
jgi:cytochrome P450